MPKKRFNLVFYLVVTTLAILFSMKVINAISFRIKQWDLAERLGVSMKDYPPVSAFPNSYFFMFLNLERQKKKCTKSLSNMNKFSDAVIVESYITIIVKTKLMQYALRSFMISMENFISLWEKMIVANCTTRDVFRDY